METNTTYTPPEILNDLDENIIRERMLQTIPNTIDKTIGGFAYDFIAPSAIEKADMVILLNEIVQLFFPEWSRGIYLDKIAATVGIKRRSAIAAEGIVKVTGTTGTVIPAGFIFATAATAITESIEYAAVEDTTINEDAVAYVRVRCTQDGTVGNVAQDCIVLMASPLTGIESIVNEQPITGGAEVETDDSLRERIRERDQGDDSSFVGCDADYIRWAKEIDGVGRVSVVPEWQGTGTGTVKLVIMDANGDPANDAIIQRVYNHIISPENRETRLAPIGAILTVVTATPVSIRITADVHLELGADMEEVTATFRDNLQAYFTEAKAEGYVRYTRVASVLSETAGVLDFEYLTINGGQGNYPISADDYPTISGIAFADVNSIYAIVYSANGGTGDDYSERKAHRATHVIRQYASNGFTPPVGMRFSRWNTMPDGSGTNYVVGYSYTDNADLRLYAIYEPITYGITYNVNGGVGTNVSTTKTYDVPYSIRAFSFSPPEHKRFVEWNTMPDGSGQSYTENQEYTENAPLALYAIYEYVTYTITYKAGEGTGDDVTDTKTSGAAYTIKTVGSEAGQIDFELPDGKVFDHWNTTANDDGTDYVADAQYALDGDLTLYAIYKEPDPPVEEDQEEGEPDQIGGES